MTASPGYKPQLDALRALAVSAVLVHHFLPVGKFIPEDFLTLGLLAVRLFFVLSGYLITGILLRARRLSFGLALRQFYVRRTLRIFPIYYLTLFILVLFDVPLVRAYLPWHLLYLSNVLFVRRPEDMGPTGHLWTLAVEEQFYFCWPFLILLTPYRHVLKVIIGAIVVGLGWKLLVALRPDMLGGYAGGSILTPACFDSLGLGALLAFIEHDERLIRYRAGILRVALIAGSAIILLQIIAYLAARDLWLWVFWASAYAGVSLVFMWVVGRAAEGFNGRLGEVMEWAPLLYVGKISYGIYLYHNFMPGLVRWAAGALGLAAPELLATPRGMPLTAPFAAALTFIVAAASWHWIEKPILRFKERRRV